MRKRGPGEPPPLFDVGCLGLITSSEELEDGRFIRIKAATEALIAIRADNPLLLAALHFGDGVIDIGRCLDRGVEVPCERRPGIGRGERDRQKCHGEARDTCKTEHVNSYLCGWLIKNAGYRRKNGILIAPRLRGRCYSRPPALG